MQVYENYSNYVRNNPSVQIGVNAAINAGIGYVIAGATSIIGTGYAVVFCATTAIIKDLADQKFRKDAFFEEQKNQDLAFFANRCVCVLISCAIVQLTGGQLAFGTGVFLWLSVSLIKAVFDDIVVKKLRNPESA